MKACILRVGSRPILDKKSIVSLELWYLRKWLLQHFESVEIHTEKIRESRDLSFAVEAESLELYDRVFVHCSTPNFFGGKCGEYTVHAARLLAEYTGAVTYVINDPAIPPVNFPGIMLGRGFVDDTWSPLAEKMQADLFRGDALFSGSTAAWESWSLQQPSVWSRLYTGFDAFFKYIAHNHLDVLPIVDASKTEFDVAYWGMRRGAHRQKLLREFLPEVSSLCIGHMSSWASESTVKQHHRDCAVHARRAAGALIIGDEMHELGWGTMRQYEAAWWGLVSFTHVDFGDPYNDGTAVRSGAELRDVVEAINEENTWEIIAAGQRNHWGII